MVLRSPPARGRQVTRVAMTFARISALLVLVVLGAQAVATLAHDARHLAVEEVR